MSEDEKFCPLLKDYCKGTECALWNKNDFECYIKTGMRRLDFLRRL